MASEHLLCSQSYIRASTDRFSIQLSFSCLRLAGTEDIPQLLVPESLNLHELIRPDLTRQQAHRFESVLEQAFENE